MNISLTPELERFVNQRVESGSYESAGEVVCAALWLLEEQEVVRQWKLLQLRTEIDIGLTAAARGDVRPADEVFDELLDRSRSVRSAT